MTQAIQNGTSAVNAEMMLFGNVREQLIADVTFKVGQLTAHHAFEMKMMGAIAVTHILIHK